MRVKAAMLGVLLFAAACDDGQGPARLTGTEFGVVVNSTDRSLSLFAVDSPQNVVSIGLGPDGSPVTLAVRRHLAVAPLGVFPAAAVVDLIQQRVVHSVPLPQNSGATGVAFLNDSIALVANTNLNTVTPINVLRGTSGAPIVVGTFPQAMIAVGDTVFVLNGELENFEPARNGTISVVTGAPAAVVATVQLSGTNPLSATIGTDGLIYVINAGSFGEANGSLSVVDRRTRTELRRETGFGDFPGSVAAGRDGRLFVAAFGFGVAVWDPATRTFVRTPQFAIQAGGIAGASGVGVDQTGRIYVLKPDCQNPSLAYRLLASYAVEREVVVGICPFAITFTRFESETP